MERNVFSVSQINDYLKAKLEEDDFLSAVAVSGEISNYKLYPSGHHYFTLKDAGGALKCVLFKGNAMRLRFRPENGMQVIAMGHIAVYPRDGAYQLYCAALLPDGVLLDGSLLDTLPEYHRKSCAMDALAQGIESWWAKKATPDSRIHAERAIRGVLDNLTAYLQGDRKAQDEMLHAAYESGVAILTTRTTAAHAMSYQITKKLGAAHGHACMLTLPHLWAHLAAQAEYQPMLTELSRILGGEKPMDGAILLKGLLAVLELDKIPMPDDATLDRLAASVNPERLGNHPEALTMAQLRAIYVQAFTPMTDTERAEAIAAWEQYGK